MIEFALPMSRPILARQGRDDRIPPMLPKELLDILICPACRSQGRGEHKLALDEQRQVFKCAACRRVYPIKDGIPILLVDEARIEE